MDIEQGLELIRMTELYNNIVQCEDMESLMDQVSLFKHETTTLIKNPLLIMILTTAIQSTQATIAAFSMIRAMGGKLAHVDSLKPVEEQKIVLPENVLKLNPKK